MTRLAWVFLGSLGVINVLAFLAFGLDKWKARRGSWRTPELTLVLFAVLGGWPGAWFGMRTFRHKTQKKSFQTKLLIKILLNLGLWFTAWHFGLLAEIFGAAPLG